MTWRASHEWTASAVGELCAHCETLRVRDARGGDYFIKRAACACAAAVVDLIEQADLVEVGFGACVPGGCARVLSSPPACVTAPPFFRAPQFSGIGPEAGAELARREARGRWRRRARAWFGRPLPAPQLALW
jgi:hypothetical protein